MFFPLPPIFPMVPPEWHIPLLWAEPRSLPARSTGGPLDRVSSQVRVPTSLTVCSAGRFPGLLDPLALVLTVELISLLTGDPVVGWPTSFGDCHSRRSEVVRLPQFRRPMFPFSLKPPSLPDLEPAVTLVAKARILFTVCRF